jgi:hypothetical protein
VPNPYGGRAGERMYRTGDKVRYLEDGRIEFLGRMDNQVKLRGYRIELSEIEAALSSYAGVRQAVVMAREDEAGEKRLVGYVVGTEEIAAEKLRAYLQEKLPRYMVPNVYVPLGELPLTPNGKVDRQALPMPEFGVSGRQYVAPRTGVEQIVARVFAEVLKFEHVGIRDDFFKLGGHSLSAAQVISRVRLACKTDLPLRALFESPTVEGLARQVERAVRDGRGLSGPAPRRADRTQSLPLSFSQQGLWFIHQLEPESAAYNVPGVLRLEGELDVAALKRSLQEIGARRPIAGDRRRLADRTAGD